MRVLVTGASGFVGSHLVEELVRQKHSVRILLRSKLKPEFLQNLACETVVADYQDPVSLKKAVKNIELIFHVGGVTKALDRSGYLAGNAQPTKALLEAVVASKTKLKRFVLVSSHAMIGPVAGPELASEEDDPARPVEEYGRSKLAAELITRAFSHLVPITIIRPPTVYGPRDRDCFEIFKLVNRRLDLYYGNAKKHTSLVYVADLVNGMIKAATSAKAVNRAYFICNDRSITWKELQQTIKKAVGKRGLTIYLPGFVTRIAAFFGELTMKITKKPLILNREKVKLGQPKFWIASNKRAKRELGFKPRYSLEEGVALSLAWYRENNWL